MTLNCKHLGVWAGEVPGARESCILQKMFLRVMVQAGVDGVFPSRIAKLVEENVCTGGE